MPASSAKKRGSENVVDAPVPWAIENGESSLLLSGDINLEVSVFLVLQLSPAVAFRVGASGRRQKGPHRTSNPGKSC